MSHYTVVKNTQINDLPILMKSLQKLGYEAKSNHFIEGHQRKRRVDMAVKVHGDYCVGFKINKRNTYDIVADWSYSNISSKRFIASLKQVYNTEKVIHEAKLRGYSLIQQKVANGGIRLVLRKMA